MDDSGLRVYHCTHVVDARLGTISNCRKEPGRNGAKKGRERYKERRQKEERQKGCEAGKSCQRNQEHQRRQGRQEGRDEKVVHTTETRRPVLLCLCGPP